MNYTRGGKETLDGIVRVWRRQLRVAASRCYSPLQASLFCFGTVVINGSAFRFIVHFRRDWFSRHRFCCGLTLCANTSIGDYSARFCCQLLVSIPGTFHIYIYILRRSPRQKLCRPFQRILPTIVSLYRQCSKLLRHRV